MYTKVIDVTVLYKVTVSTMSCKSHFCSNVLQSHCWNIVKKEVTDRHTGVHKVFIANVKALTRPNKQQFINKNCDLIKEIENDTGSRSAE